MLKKDKNGFLRLIQEQGYMPNQFNAYDEFNGDLPSFVIELKDSPLKFWTRCANYSHHEFDCNYITFSPSYTDNGFEPMSGFTDSIEPVYHSFVEWLNDEVAPYLEETTQIDLWETFSHQSITPTQYDDRNTRFSQEEKATVLLMIENFTVKIQQEYTPTQIQLADINYQLGYLTESIDRHNKFDWKSLLLSTIIGIMTTLSLDSSQGRAFVSIAREIFTHSLLILQ